MTIGDDKIPTSVSMPVPIPVPSFGYAPAPAPKRILWKWSLVATAAVLGFLMWQCGSALRTGRVLSDKAVHRFRTQLNSGRYEDICQEADESFSEGGRHDDTLKLLEAVHRKLGDAGAENQINVNVNAATGGTFITADYNTSYTQGQAMETFTWKRSGGTLKLYAYNVQSKALLN